MIEVGSLRIRARNSAIFANLTQRQSEETNRVFFCPFSNETQMNNMIDNGYSIDFCPSGNIIDNEYVGGVIGCSSIKLDLTKPWSVEFDYICTSSPEQDAANLSTDWNVIFGFGSHSLDIKKVDYVEYAITANTSSPDIKSWCNVDNVKTWHRYIINYTGTNTTATIDNVQQTIRQFDYLNKVQGFFLSGGGSSRSIPCKIRNLSILAALTN